MPSRAVPDAEADADSDAETDAEADADSDAETDADSSSTLRPSRLVGVSLLHALPRKKRATHARLARA